VSAEARDSDHEESGRRHVLDERAPAVESAKHPESPAQRLASRIGNQNFTQLVARMADGEGIMPGGAIHPDVTSAIAAMSGSGGRPLPKQMARKLEKTHGDLSDARVHTGPEAAALSRAVSARAFTVGTHMFFNDGEFQPHSRGGQELVAHEAAHVVQQRHSAQTGSLQVSTPGDALEREADAVSNGVSD
jgi:hypothetical protein